MDNVIKFPKERRGGVPPQNIEDITANINTFRKDYIVELTGAIVEQILDMFELNGITISGETGTYDKDFAFLIESVRSMLHKYFKMEYEHTEALDKMVTLKTSPTGMIEYEFNYKEDTSK